MRRGIRHAEDKFLEPLEGIWRVMPAGHTEQEEKREREERDGRREREKRLTVSTDEGRTKEKFTIVSSDTVSASNGVNISGLSFIHLLFTSTLRCIKPPTKVKHVTPPACCSQSNETYAAGVMTDFATRRGFCTTQ